MTDIDVPFVVAVEATVGAAGATVAAAAAATDATTEVNLLSAHCMSWCSGVFSSEDIVIASFSMLFKT